LQGDWSSDVCSSDLGAQQVVSPPRLRSARQRYFDFQRATASRENLSIRRPLPQQGSPKLSISRLISMVATAKRPFAPRSAFLPRSEERRVGKDCIYM